MDAVVAYVTKVSGYAPLGVPETTHYSALEALLDAAGEELSPQVLCVLHAKGSDAGLPDANLVLKSHTAQKGNPGLDLFADEHKLPERGVVEVKGLDADLDALIASEQIARYAAKYGQVLATNLREFAVVQMRDGTPTAVETFTLAKTPGAFHALAEDPRTAARLGRPLIEFLRRALSATKTITTPGELAFHLASHARTARANLDQFESPLELEQLKDAIEKALGVKFDPVRGDAFFRSSLVQTIFYGLFAAWILWCESEDGVMRAGKFALSDVLEHLTIPIVDALFSSMVMRDVARQTSMRKTIRNSIDVLNRTDRASFFESMSRGEAVAYFYEPFLSSFDPTLRKELGVWYTPPEIVRAMVNKVDKALVEDLGIEDGLADPSVILLDPACGTGAFLIEALKVVIARLHARGGPVTDLIRKTVTERFYGFEMLTGPFVIAHLQVMYTLARAKAPLLEGERAGVILTNALTGYDETKDFQVALDTLRLKAESVLANSVKRDKRILVILGNPPYLGFAGISKIEEERELSARYAPEGERRKGQGLNDLYVRFFAMADRRVAEGGRGVICLVSNYSWLEGASFRTMREKLMAGYDRILIDNLHGDSRATGKMTPHGKPDPSAFSTESNRMGIQVGTAVTTLIRRDPSGMPRSNAQILYRDFWGASKRADFFAGKGEYIPLYPSPVLGLPFRPRSVSSEYTNWPRITELMPKYLAGVQTKRDDFLVAIDRPRLEQRLRAYFDKTVPHSEIARHHPRVMEETNRFSPEMVRDTLQKRGILSDHVVRYAFRPFDVRWVYWEPETRLLGEKVPESFPYSNISGQLWLVSQEKVRRDWNGPLLSSVLCNLHLTEWSASCFPLRLAPSHAIGGGLVDVDPAEPRGRAHWNLSPMAWTVLAREGLEDAPEALFHHALAILHAPAYAREHADALRGDWPRIPLAGEPGWLSRGLALGGRAAALLDIERSIPGVDAGAPAPELRPIGDWLWSGAEAYREGTDDLALSGAWGYADKRGAVMPGGGRLIEDGDGTLIVVMNANAAWHGVPREVWEFRLGGYPVLKKWLSYRERGVLGRPLNLDEIRTFTAIARRLASLLALAPELDAHYAECAVSRTPA